GSAIAFTVPKRAAKPAEQLTLFDLLTASLSGNHERVLVPDVPLDIRGSSFSWSPNSMQVAYRRIERGGPSDCYAVGIDGGDSLNLTTWPPGQGMEYLASARPLWDKEGEHVYLVREGTLWRASIGQSKAIELARIAGHRISELAAQPSNVLWAGSGNAFALVVAFDDVKKQDGFYEIDLMNGQSTALLEKGQSYLGARVGEDVIISRDGQQVAYFSEDAEHDSDIWMSDIGFRKPRQVTHLNAQFSRYKMGAARLVDWLSDNGERLQGVLLLPSQYEQGNHYPLIVRVYGGTPLSNCGFNTFGLEGAGPFNGQLLATRGYAVLCPDAPQHPGTPMVDLAKAVLPGVNKVIEMGIADPNRLGVVGHSYGGYSALSLIVQTKRFRAAVESDGMADLIADYGAMGKQGTAYSQSVLEHGQGLMGGTPWQYRERYIENSPFFYLDRVETPLLIVHGSEDQAVSSFLGDEIYSGLRRLGKEVVYAKYEGENHGPSGWSYANQVDFCNRVIAWFEEHLKR
ncbi:MAG TPA: alpha/beta fold hydrolase, partial [Candidatus Acidoferrales bacterium]|nr:alpha/beta fold hydrolase [Candidatus Acidoferrales bacterium]